MRGQEDFVKRLGNQFLIGWAICLAIALTESAIAVNVPNRVDTVPISGDLSPHFEKVDGRPVFFVEGVPSVVLSVEIPWMRLIYGEYQQTMGAYDYLYPAAAEMGLNAVKVPVKWSMVEPSKGSYDFSYVDHVKSLAERYGLKLVLGWFGHYASGDGTIYRNLAGEVFAPMDIILDSETYPRAVDADGISHHNVASYDSDAIIGREVEAFTAFMRHIREVDAEDRTILMVQVENEIAVFGADRQNPKLWRDHSPASNERFEKSGFDSDLRFSAWRFSSNWIRRLTDAGAAAYPLPFFLNFVGGKVADWMIGGAPGEHVPYYLDNCPEIDFIGLNLYTSSESSAHDLRASLRRYQIGRNLPSVTETNSGSDSVDARLAFLSIGEFGAPLFAPWSLDISYPSPYQPYVRGDGSLAHGAFRLRDCYTALRGALPLIASRATTDDLAVFLSSRPGEEFSTWKELRGVRLSVSGVGDGQAIAIATGPTEFFIAGYRCRAALSGPDFVWPEIRDLKVDRGVFEGADWKRSETARYSVNQSSRSVGIALDEPQVVRVSW